MDGPWIASQRPPVETCKARGIVRLRAVFGRGVSAHGPAPKTGAGFALHLRVAAHPRSPTSHSEPALCRGATRTTGRRSVGADAFEIRARVVSGKLATLKDGQRQVGPIGRRAYSGRGRRPV
jgi:hypothetical protein